MTKKDRLLRLAQETIKLFREAEDYRLKHRYRCGFRHDVWLKIQNKACLKAIDFEVLAEEVTL